MHFGRVTGRVWLADRGLVQTCAGCGGAIAAPAPVAYFLPALADTLDGALVLGLQNNPTLNSQRAAVRATDETVPQALSGYRPRVSFNGQRRRAVSRLDDDQSATPARRNTYTQLSGNIDAELRR